MQFSLAKDPLSQIAADTLVVGIFQDEDLAAVIKDLDAGFPETMLQELSQTAQSEDFTGKSGQMLQMPGLGKIKATRLILRGLGKQGEYENNHARKNAASLLRKLSAGARTASAALYLRLGAAAAVQAICEGAILGAYSFRKYKTSEKDKKWQPPQAVALGGTSVSGQDADSAFRRGQAIADATAFARDLIAEPASFMTPTRLAENALSMANPADHITCQVLDVQDAQHLGLGAFLGVARGAQEPPKFIVLKYSHEKPVKSIAIVGKGITFDSGGLSLKTATGMEHMKYDMSGAAAVLALFRVLAVTKPKLTVYGVAAATENMPGANALHPGDVLTALNGKTIEVNNTDAEGRLILADALSFIGRENPDETIDIATLTGGVVTALGRSAAGIMSTSTELAAAIIAAGAEAGEKLWQLPLFDDYKDSLKSDIADLKNAGAKGEAPASCAALFLKEFVNGKAWAHLDIAGPAWSDKDKDDLTKGGTAFGVRTLAYYLNQYV